MFVKKRSKKYADLCEEKIHLIGFFRSPMFSLRYKGIFVEHKHVSVQQARLLVLLLISYVLMMIEMEVRIGMFRIQRFYLLLLVL